jgi:hypothetical protein
MKRTFEDKVIADDVNLRNNYLENVGKVILHQLISGGLIYREPPTSMFDLTTNRINCPSVDDPLVGLVYGKPFIMGHDREADGVINDGGTTYLIDSSRNEVDNFWQDAFVVFTSGANEGLVRQVTSSVSATGQLNWSSALDTSVAPGDAYTVTFFYIQDITTEVLNYVYGRSLDRTTPDGVIQWVANTNGVAAEGDLYIGAIFG